MNNQTKRTTGRFSKLQQMECFAACIITKQKINDEELDMILECTVECNPLYKETGNYRETLMNARDWMRGLLDN